MSQYKVNVLLNAYDTYHVEFLELGPGKSLAEVFTIKERLNLDLGLMLGGQRSLCLLDFTTEFLHGAVVLSDVLALLLLVQLHEVFHHALVKVLTSKMGVAVGRDNLENAIVDCENGDIEGTASQIKHKDVLLTLFLVQTVSNGSSGPV